MSVRTGFSHENVCSKLKSVLVKYFILYKDIELDSHVDNIQIL